MKSSLTLDALLKSSERSGEDQNEQPKKRRGRPPSKKPKVEKTVEPKKRGRKPKQDVKTYGVNQEDKSKAVIQEEQLVLHLPVKDMKTVNFEDTLEQKLFRYDPVLTEPQPMQKNMTEDRLKGMQLPTINCESIMINMQREEQDTKNLLQECYYTSEGSLVKCELCAKKYEDELSANFEKDFEMLKNFRDNDEGVFISMPGEKEMNKLNKKITESDVLDENFEYPEYDPNDVFNETKSSEEKEESDDLDAFNYQENMKLLPKRVQPHSDYNQNIDSKAPTREEFENLYDSFETLKQRYENLKRKCTRYETMLEESENQSMTYVVEKPNKTTSITQVLSTFTSQDSWPRETNVFCWYDCHPFSTPPIPLPISYNKKDNSFRVYGVFCSFECALAYKLTDQYCRNVDDSFIYYFFNKITPNALVVKNLKKAPPRQSLRIFGGDKNIDDFRNNSKNKMLQYDLVTYPLVPIVQFVESNLKKKYDPRSALKQEEGEPVYKLKRSKPLPNHANTLETCMGLKITSDSSAAEPKKRGRKKKKLI